MDLYKPKTVQELIEILKETNGKAKISFENLPRVDFTDVHNNLPNKLKKKIDISNWDFKDIQEAIGFGYFVEKFVPNYEQVIDKLDFRNLRNGWGLFASLKLDNEHHFVFDNLVSASNLLSRTTINKPITITAPKLVMANHLLVEAKTNAPVTLNNTNLIRDLQGTYATNGDYPFDVTYLNKYFDTPEKRKAFEEFKKTLDEFNKEVLPELHSKRYRVVNSWSPSSGQGFVIIPHDATNSPKSHYSLQSRGFDDLGLSKKSTEILNRLAQLYKIFNFNLKVDQQKGVVLKGVGKDLKKALEDSIVLTDLCPSQGIKGKDSFRFAVDLKAIQEGKELPYPPIRFNKSQLKRIVDEQALHFAQFLDNKDALQLLKRAIC